MHKPELEELTPEILAQLQDDPRFRPWIIKKYRYWTLYLAAHDQALPGRSYAWLNRHVDCMELWQLSSRERDEFLEHILLGATRAFETLGPLLRVNVEWLGNEIDMHRGHGHFHLTPPLRSTVRTERYSIR